MKKVIVFQDVFIRLQGKEVLKSINWTVTDGQNWMILGLNGAGKSTLVKSIFDYIPIRSGCKSCIYRTHEIGYVAFDLEKKIHSSPPFLNIANDLQFKKLPRQPISSLSSGEMKKLLIARALAKKPKLLILDEPFEGLDESARVKLTHEITKLLKKTQLILITHRFDEIPKEISRILVLHKGKVFAKGFRESVLNQKKVKKIFSHEESIGKNIVVHKTSKKKIPDTLIQMKNVTVRYGKKIVLNKVNWMMKRGDNWAIVGPNGVGKTTLLKLITGDNLQAYGQDIKIFGMQKGSGESMWEIKKYISEVSGDLQLRYQKNISALAVPISGFFDSIGVYRQTSKDQINIAKKCMKNLGLEKLADRNFMHLSQGQLRMVIIARAMVKSPLLLILDEPTHGLDVKNRKKVFELVDWIGKNTHTHILYVTHHKNEMPICVEKILYL